MVDETISEKCENLYNKLNSFVESEISRDVTPQISNLNSRINALEPNLVRVKEVNGNASSVSAGGTSTKTFTVPACPSGYGWKYFSTSTGWGTVSSVSLSGTTLTVTLLNVSNTSHDISFSGALVYYPNTIEAEPHITLSATNPYLLDNEVTDLVVSLVDEFGFPLRGKTVIISDGTSSYNGITNNQGTFTLPDISVSSDTTFTATYSNVSATCKVILATKRDYGTSSNHDDIWKSNSSTPSFSFIRDVAYTEMKELVSSNFGNDTSITAPCTIEVDFYQVDGYRNQAFFQILGSNNSSLATRNLGHIGGFVGEWVHLKLEISSNQLIFTNTDNNQSSTTTWSSGTPAKFNWWSSSDITAIRFKNFVIY